MKTTIASGYIKKTKAIKDKQSITNGFAAYEGDIVYDKQKILVQVYSDSENFKNKEVFVRLSIDAPFNI